MTRRNLFLSLSPFIICIAAFAALIPVGHWQDEYSVFPMYGKGGIPMLVWRLREWSPRPFSEAIIFCYANVVMALKTPLISASLIFSWLFLPLSILAAVALDSNSKRSVAIIGTAMFALFISGHKNAEMYYWPMAALAYIPAAAALLFLFLSMLRNNVDKRSVHISQAIALVILATSIEIGAMFSLAFIALMVMLNLIFSRSRTSLHWLLVPAIVSIAVLALLYFGRVTSSIELMGDPSIAHHAINSLIHGGKAFFQSLFSLDGPNPDAASIIRGSISKILLALSIFFIVRAMGGISPRARLILIAFSITCFATSFLTISAAMYQFGLLCCDRHDTLRECLFLLGIAAATASTVSVRAESSRPNNVGYVLLVVAVWVAFSGSVTDLRVDYRRYGDLYGAQERNWISGRAQRPDMDFLIPVPGRIVGGLVNPDGTYQQSKSPPVIPLGIMTLFDKQEITVRNVP